MIAALKRRVAVLAMLTLLVPAGCARAVQEQPHGRMVAYSGATQGYMVRPVNGLLELPAVILLHEWWGLTGDVRAEADRYAAEGYLVLAPDLYDGRVAQTPEQARALSGGVSEGPAVANMAAALDFVRRQPNVNAGSVSAVGYCFGGRWALRLAQARPGLSALVIYYGRVPTDPSRLAGLPPVLGHFGTEDANIPPAQVAAFDRALSQAGVTHQIYNYPGVGHAFAGPARTPARYDEEAAEQAWQRTVAFLAEHGRYGISEGPQRVPPEQRPRHTR